MSSGLVLLRLPHGATKLVVVGVTVVTVVTELLLDEATAPPHLVAATILHARMTAVTVTAIANANVTEITMTAAAPAVLPIEIVTAR